jgi:hypothetical protein
LGLFGTEGLGHLAPIFLVHPGGIGTVEMGRISPTVTPRALTARGALDDGAGQHRAYGLDLGHDGRSTSRTGISHAYSIPDRWT